jgi:predicted  nucleic acid-binding Zn-ribbon protein
MEDEIRTLKAEMTAIKQREMTKQELLHEQMKPIEKLREEMKELKERENALWTENETLKNTLASLQEQQSKEQSKEEELLLVEVRVCRSGQES